MAKYYFGCDDCEQFALLCWICWSILLDLLCGGWIDFAQINFIEVGRFRYEKADSQIGDRRYMMDGGGV